MNSRENSMYSPPQTFRYPVATTDVPLQHIWINRPFRDHQDFSWSRNSRLGNSSIIPDYSPISSAVVTMILLSSHHSLQSRQFPSVEIPVAASLRFQPDYLPTGSAMKFSSLRFESADCSRSLDVCKHYLRGSLTVCVRA